MRLLCASDQDVVHGYVDQLDQVPRGAHDEEADADGLADLDELLLVGLRAPVDELTTVLDELLGNVEDLVRHGCWWWCWCWWVMLIRYVGDYAMLLRNGGRREKPNVEGGKK